MLIISKNWQYSNDCGWGCYFQYPSNCQNYSLENGVSQRYNPNFAEEVIANMPSKYYKLLKDLHHDPAIW